MNESPARRGTKVLASMVQRHLDQASFLWSSRAALLRRADITLNDIGDRDERIEAHLDGIRIGQARGWQACLAALGNAGAGEVFVAALMALEFDTQARLAPLLELVDAEPGLWRGWVGALGWASARDLRGTANRLLSSSVALRRRSGVLACMLHRADPGALLAALLCDDDPTVRAVALHAAGVLGRRDLLPAVLAVCHEAHADDVCRFWAAWSGALLGDRGETLEVLAQSVLEADALAPGLRQRAFRLLLLCAVREQGRRTFSELVRRGHLRLAVEGAGWLGDPLCIPWLVDRSEDPRLARLAGQSWTFITGVELVHEGLAMRAPEGMKDDEHETEDRGLPWPDPAMLRAWWSLRARCFGQETSFFLGQARSMSTCVNALRNGTQRQRAVAAELACVLQPGTLQFATQAAAWRQFRRLDAAAI